MSLCNTSTSGRWTHQQHQKFLIGLELFGKNWKKIQDIVKTRNGSQIRSHAQKHFLKIKKSGKYIEDPQPASKQKIGDVSTPIQKSFYSIPDNQTSYHSYFMKIIVKYAKIHENFDLWDAFIDDGGRKETVTQVDSLPHQDSSHKQDFFKPQNTKNTINETGEH